MDLMELAVPGRKNLSHDQIYDRIIDALGGPEALRQYLPRPVPELSDTFARDRNLNSIPLGEWDAAAGFIHTGARNGWRVYVPSGGVWPLLSAHGVTWSSASQNVCLLKRAAIRLIRTEKGETTP